MGFNSEFKGLSTTHIFFFFYLHYNPLWVLAFSVILFHSAVSFHWLLHFLIPIICIFSSISAIHLYLALPLIFVWVLTFSVIPFHSALSFHWFHHRLIPIICIFFDICNPSLPWSPSNSRTYRFPL